MKYNLGMESIDLSVQVTTLIERIMSNDKFTHADVYFDFIDGNVINIKIDMKGININNIRNINYKFPIKYDYIFYYHFLNFIIGNYYHFADFSISTIDVNKETGLYDLSIEDQSINKDVVVHFKSFYDIKCFNSIIDSYNDRINKGSKVLEKVNK